uniref:Uncharacterized protein n=1 Tax=Oryza punctata TaxID=4537 RepID=A0A0E0KRR5_ORYPU
MGRVPCCEKDNVKRGQWTPEEDNKLLSYITQYGTRNWRLIPKNAGLQRCGKSCRLRWTNYLRPDLKHGEFTDAEEQTIIKLHSVVGNRWSVIAAQLPGRTDNDVKNHWNTKLKKKLSGMGIDPVTHKSFSHLMAEIATTLAPPQVAHLAEAALGCFKDEMLHLLTKKRPSDFPSPAVHDGAGANASALAAPCFPTAPPHHPQADDTIERIKLGLSRAIMSDPSTASAAAAAPSAPAEDKPWPPGDISEGLAGMYATYNPAAHAQAQAEFRYDGAAAPGYVLGGDGDQGTSMWSHQSLYSGSSGTEEARRALPEKGNDSVGSSGGDDDADDGKDSGKGGASDMSGLFASDCVLWDLPDELTNHMV